ncbi:hypothetical protein [Salipaludibacillus daqingensis]|uniref:hypothetical protein n=1 Tax=Salipaludibacillus daqingensis TaxID=3041001 RepID=UPI0024747447|nr:hypothetical protein [Salipaludibacillus daqingensis]
MDGKTHDLQESKGDIRMYYFMCGFFFLSGLVMIIASISIKEMVAYLFLGGAGFAFIIIGIHLVKKVNQLDRFIGYGIDEEEGVLWDGVFEEGRAQPVETFKIPIESVNTVLLAPHELFYSHRASNKTYTYYFYVPVVLIVFEENGLRYYSRVTFIEDEDVNTWLTRAQQAGLQLYLTDEAVNDLYKESEAPELIESDIHKKAFTFNGNISSYINRNKKEDYKHMPTFKKGESRHLDEDTFVSFKWGFRHIFAVGTVLLLLSMLLEQWYLTSVQNMDSGEVTLFGLIAGAFVLGASHVLYGYALKRFRGISLFIVFSLSVASYFIASVITTIVLPLTETHDPHIQIFQVYLIAFIPLVVVSLIIRKWKPAHHHFKVEKQKERLRYSS